MNKEDFKEDVFSFTLLILSIIFMFFLYRAIVCLNEDVAHPDTEEEKEYILDGCPSGVPSRFWD